MKKDSIFITRLARSAVATGITACAVHQTGIETTKCLPVAHESIMTHEVTRLGTPIQVSTDPASKYSFTPLQNQWDKKLEREFRTLALKEAKQDLTPADRHRLEELNTLRDRLLNPQPAEEILAQIKRDRLLSRIQEILNEYVEFEEATRKTRAAA